MQGIEATTFGHGLRLNNLDCNLIQSNIRLNKV